MKLSGQVWRPEPLSWPEPRKFEDGKIDLPDLHNATRARFLGMVDELCKRYRREFPAYKYSATARDRSPEYVSLLVAHGGLPGGTETLNGVPAAIFERAVKQLAECFGLEGASGNLSGAGTVPAEMDPKPRKRKTLEAAPW